MYGYEAVDVLGRNIDFLLLPEQREWSAPWSPAPRKVRRSRSGRPCASAPTGQPSMSR